MKREMRARSLLAVIAVVALLAWFVFPGPFVRGVVLGIVSTLGLLAGGVFLLGKKFKKRVGSNLKPPPIPTGAWDYSMELTDLSGTPLDCSPFSGEVLVLNFWATWCAPCVAEMPSLQGLQERTSDLGVQLALVTREPAEVVQKFVEKQGLGLPVYLLTGETPTCFESRAIPATFILDRAGMIVMRHFGAAKWDADAVVTFIRGLAASPPG